ncbi:serine-rich protein [Stemphylium lycopersici]|nr:serine-rich protein [Stemphylium lycopersici]
MSSHRRAKSQNSISSTSIPQGPRFSPPKSPTKDSSPVRKPLHERSHSQTNQHAGPTIRIVQDPSNDIYQKYPVPSEPSQILPPPRHAPGYGFERADRPGSLVSSGSQVANTIAKFEASRAQTPQPILSRRKGRRHSAATSMSEEDTLIASSFTPSSVRFSQGSTAPSSPPPEFEDYEKGLEVLEEEPPVQRQTIRAVPPSSSGGDSLDSRALTPKASAASFASPVPAAEPSSFSNAGNPSSVSVGRPLPQDDEHTPTPESEAGRSALACYTDYRQPVLKPQQSTDSFTFSDISYTSIEPTTSPTLHEASTASFASGIRLNYPVVRAASSNSLRADSQNLPNISSRMQDRSLIHNWSSQLSTIPSGSERDSRSLARASRSQSFGARSHSQESYGGNGRATIPRRRGQTVSSAQSSSDNVSSEGHTEFSAVPRPLFSPVSRGSSDNNSEHMDTISPLPSSIPLRMKNSGYLRRNNSVDGLSMTESRPGSSGRPGSASSNMSNFLANNIPAWARMYYQKGERISVAVPPESESSGSIRPGTSQSGRSRTPSESNFPLSIYRPRNRPRNRAASHTDTVSLADDVHSIDGAACANGPQMYQLTGYSTPHLRTDQRGQALYSAWNAPSLDDDIHLTLFGRQNRQILLFCLGFLCPLTWMIASFLPLPLDPNSAATPTSSQADLEQQFAQNMGPANDKAFQKATWWRNLNRVMSGVGTLLIGVIIVLAILASRM